jgi:DNA polymerase III epsilon subunit-like protein
MQITKIIAIDVETTGFSKGADITHNHQIVSIGLIIADANFKPLDKFYCEIKWNGTSHWDKNAERVHGLSKEYLEEHGDTEEDAVLKIAEFLLAHFEATDYLYFLGHNPRNFDIPFFLKLTNKYDVYFKLGHRTVDSFSVGFTTLGTMNSDELFSYFYDTREKHNALQDAEMSLGVCRKIKTLMSNILNE